jgi:hypothetical protein
VGFPDRKIGMSEYVHNYGRISGHGNRYSHKINDIILDYMVEELKLVGKNPKEWRIPGHRGNRKRHKLSDIANVVRKRMERRGVSGDTITRHLEELVATRILLEDPKRGRNNERYFLLSRIIRLRDKQLPPSTTGKTAKLMHYFRYTPEFPATEPA